MTYPIHFRVEYQPGPRDRRLTLLGVLYPLRILAIVPHAVVLGAAAIPGVVVLIASLAVIVATGTIPPWGVRWTLGLTNWGNRVSAWLYGMRDEYPPFSFDAPYPAGIQADLGVPERSRGLAALGLLAPLKALLALPHLLIVTAIGSVLSVFAWIGYLMTYRSGVFPTDLHRIFSGWLTWSTRTVAWMLSLVDEYPPFEWDDGERPVAG